MKYKCEKCGQIIDYEHNFCPYCGQVTAKGFMFFKDPHNQELFKGAGFALRKRIGMYFSLCVIILTIGAGLVAYRQMDLFRPFAYLNQKYFYYKHGYYRTLLDNNILYEDEIDSELEAKSLIKKDTSNQSWKCVYDEELSRKQVAYEEKYGIMNINLCDLDLETSEKIFNVLDVYDGLFPNTLNRLTNLTLTNSDDDNDFIAVFNPLNNILKNSDKLVNKTEILLNSYFFLNKDIMNSYNIRSQWYVKNASWESLLAHELGHYLLYYYALSSFDNNSFLYVNEDNMIEFADFENLFLNEYFAKGILDNLNISEVNMSEYAAESFNLGNYSEVIAEAVHDYFVNREDADSDSLRIVYYIKGAL